MFLISVIAFVVGIYIEAIYPVPLAVSLISCLFFLCVIPHCPSPNTSNSISYDTDLFYPRRYGAAWYRHRKSIRDQIQQNKDSTSLIQILTETPAILLLSMMKMEEYRMKKMNIYEGLVTEASPNTKIIKLISPRSFPRPPGNPENTG